jgi:hypothetical protein
MEHRRDIDPAILEAELERSRLLTLRPALCHLYPLNFDWTYLNQVNGLIANLLSVSKAPAGPYSADPEQSIVQLYDDLTLEVNALDVAVAKILLSRSLMKSKQIVPQAAALTI